MYFIVLRDFLFILCKIGLYSFFKNYFKFLKFDIESVLELKSKMNCKKFKKDEVECE